MKTITSKIHLNSEPERVFELLTTPKGQERFWVESSQEKDGLIHFTFPNGQTYTSRILDRVADKEFSLDYFNSVVTFHLESNGNGGTHLTVVNTGVSDEEYTDIYAGWTSVLLNLKAVADHDADLRNHDPDRTWDQGYVDN